MVFQNFREYAKVIFSLTDAQVAVETECWRSIRERIIQSGTPLWALKYLADGDYVNPNLREATLRVVDLLHEYAMREGERESIMSSVFQMMTGHGKVRVILQGALRDKERRAAAFRRFLFEASPELERIVNKLDLQPILLSDLLASIIGNSRGGRELSRGRVEIFRGKEEGFPPNLRAGKYYPALTASPSDTILSGRRQPALVASHHRQVIRQHLIR